MSGQASRLPLAVSAVAVVVSLAGIWTSMRAGDGLPPVLIYDQAEVDAQAQAYLDKGFDGVVIVNQAFDQAKERGHLILRASKDVAYPPEALFRITDFISAP